MSETRDITWRLRQTRWHGSEWGTLMAEAASEIERLRSVVAWYGDEAQAIAKALNGKTVIDNPQAVEASMTVLALDAGRKASAALGQT